MGIILSRGGLTQSQKEHCIKTGKSEIQYLSELKKLPINNPKVSKPATQKVPTIQKKTTFKPKKFSWKK